MRLSLQIHYAICGIFDLAYNGQDGPVQVRVVGERQGIPTRYLEQIFQRLRRAGLVTSKRGPGGGYRLARSASEINLRDIVDAVDGPLDGPSDLGGGSGGASSVAYRPNFIWPDLAGRFAGVLAETSVEALCRTAARSAVPRAGADVYTYQI
jgi:Rrf2 family iron-sulfur cluster assembly transcriptional regulator